ncbi:serine protease [Actibacterium sp. 188UL27-1]|uniref:trypsin-like serine peptidase n=1 Tax=Actibacterium sp. 188UL27-1 TaxID=2786961 RepID=UPI00195E4D27|nr:trypsin-like serine protease [Actibacterium sp. 188UL27-1]MBM7068180.1 trypsin-like serine protease [Actibacterium sp. 188UL27-1]
MRHGIWIILAALLMGGPQAGLTQTKDRLDRRDKLFGFESVGRLESRGGNCTAALITRDVALTAAHCVYRKGTDFVFRAGYSDGAAIATRKAVDVVIAPGYLEAKKTGDWVSAIANDVALVRLIIPIYDHGANPYQLAKTPREGAKLTLASYGQGRMEALTLERGCSLNTQYRQGIVGMDCDATFGSSGAPVFVQVAGTQRIFSIVSSGTNSETGEKITYGVELAKHVPKLLQVLRNRRALAPVGVGARRVRIGERTEGGARFVRPGG